MSFSSSTPWTLSTLSPSPPFCKRVDDFKKLNCAVLAMSTDSVYSHKAFVKASKYVLTFILPIRNDKTVIKSQE